jgi:hypothetical protein
MRLFRERGWTVSNFTSQVNSPAKSFMVLIWRRDPRCAIRSLLPLLRHEVTARYAAAQTYPGTAG